MRNLGINNFIFESLWIYNAVLIVLAGLIIYLFILIRKTKSRKEFLAKLSREGGPLNPINLLPTLIDSIPDFVYIKDEKGRFIVANKKLAETMGQVNGKQLVGMTDFDFYPRKMAEQFRLDELEIMKSGRPLLNSKEKGIDKNGNEIWVSTSKIPIKNNSGKVVGIAGIGKDITETLLDHEKLEEQKKILEESNILLEERQEEILQQQEEMKTTAEILSKERNQLLTLVNSMPDRIYIKDGESRFILGNVHVAKIMGAKKPEDLVGKTDYDFYPKEMADSFYNDEQQLMAKGISLINKEEIGYNESGEEVVVSTTKIPIKNSTGEVIGVVGIGRDITFQKHAEKELREQSMALGELNVLLEERQEEIQQQDEELKAQSENLLMLNRELEKLSVVASKTSNVIIIMDAKGNFEWVNSGFVQRYGKDLQQFIKENGKNLKVNSSNKMIGEILEQLYIDKKSKIYNSQSVDLNGNKVWSQSTISPVLDENGEIISLIIIDSDISRLKEAEFEIESQRDELTKVNATKDKFFSIIAHDLKNPFHSIMGFSDLLSRSFDAIEDNKKKEFINLINESSTSAYGLLENLLSWARTQTNKIKFEPSKINIRMVIEEIVQMSNVNAENKNIEFILPEGDEEIITYADYNMVNTILRNLISNALKFTEDGGKISISTEIQADRLLVSVKDSGIGMDNETINSLFSLESFSTSKGTQGEQGTGLGLIVCSEFVQIHGGEIKVESTPGKGSVFSFTLPLEAPKT